MRVRVRVRVRLRLRLRLRVRFRVRPRGAPCVPLGGSNVGSGVFSEGVRGERGHRFGRLRQRPASEVRVRNCIARGEPRAWVVGEQAVEKVQGFGGGRHPGEPGKVARCTYCGFYYG